MTVKRVCVAFFGLSGACFAGTHWVSPNGVSAWSACVGASDPGVYCALTIANTNAIAGDTVYLKGGTYSTTKGFTGAIQPSNNGTSGSVITFSAAPGETPVITEQTGTRIYGIYFGYSSASSYIKVSGITFSDIYYWGNVINGSNHIELAGNTWTSDLTFVPSDGLNVTGANNQNWVTNIWIHGNTFSGANSNTNGCTDGGGNLLYVGTGYGTYSGNMADNDNYITIENNVFYHAAHAALDDYGMYQVIKNNVFHNEPWSSGCPLASQTQFPDTNAVCTGVNTPWQFCNGNPGTAYPYTNPAYNGFFGHRNFQITDDYNRTALYDLVEGNRSGYASANQGNDGADNFDLAAPQNIIRYNFFYDAMQSGLMFKYYYTSGLGGGGHGGTYNRVYNNTFYNNGTGYLPYYNNGQACSTGECPDAIGNMALQTNASGQGNVVVNNLMYLGGSNTYYTLDTVSRSGSPHSIYTQVASMANNFCTSMQSGCTAYGNPLFVNPDLTNVASMTLPNLSLSVGSPAIDGGTYLTTANGAGAGSTTLVVNDAAYFQDGTWGASMAQGVTLFPDWIAIGTVKDIIQISAVNYATNTLTLASPMTWSNGAKIWLYKKSDGAAVLAGTAPDLGASEYLAPLPPTNLQTVVH